MSTKYRHKGLSRNPNPLPCSIFAPTCCSLHHFSPSGCVTITPLIPKTPKRTAPQALRMQTLSRSCPPSLSKLPYLLLHCLRSCLACILAWLNCTVWIKRHVRRGLLHKLRVSKQRAPPPLHPCEKTEFVTVVCNQGRGETW